MKYVPPIGATGVDDPYVDGDPSIAREGSIVPAASIEHPQREIVNLIDKSDFTPNEGDLEQLTRATRSQYINFVLDTGSTDVLSVTLDPALGIYKQGLPLRVLVANTNTGAATINVNGLGARPIKRTNGADLVAGDIVAGGIAVLVDDGTVFQITNFLGAIGGTVNNISIDIPYAEDSGTPNNVIASFSPAITSPSAGDLVLVKIANVNTGAVTIAVNAIPAIAIRRIDGQPLQGRDLILDEVILLEFHTSYWQMMRFVRSQLFLKLEADLILYVRTDGNDANDGSANDAAHAFLHIQAAIDYATSSFLIGARTVTIQLGIPGTYNGPARFENTPGNFVLEGGAAFDTYIVAHSPTGSDLGVAAAYNSSVRMSQVTFFNGNGSQATVQCGYNAQLELSNVRFTGVSGDSDVVAGGGGSVIMSNFIDFYRSTAGGIVLSSGSSLTIGPWSTIIRVNGVTFSSAFLTVFNNSVADIASSFAGVGGAGAFGPRFSVYNNSVIDTHGGGANYLPGSVAGTTDASSVYA